MVIMQLSNEECLFLHYHSSRISYPTPKYYFELFQLGNLSYPKIQFMLENEFCLGYLSGRDMHMGVELLNVIDWFWIS